MPDHRGTLRRTRPVLAGSVLAGRKGRAVTLRTREHVVAIRRVAGAVDDLALFGERGLLGEIVAGAVEVGDILGDHDAFRILPRPLADAVARVHRQRMACGRSTASGRPSTPKTPSQFGTDSKPLVASPVSEKGGMHQG